MAGILLSLIIDIYYNLPWQCTGQRGERAIDDEQKERVNFEIENFDLGILSASHVVPDLDYNVVYPFRYTLASRTYIERLSTEQPTECVK